MYIEEVIKLHVGGTNVTEKIIRDKVAKKAAKPRTSHGGTKGSIAGKVWETLAAVTKGRGSYADINKAAALIVRLDEIGPSNARSASLMNIESASATFGVTELARSVGSDPDLRVEEKDIFTEGLATKGSSSKFQWIVDKKIVSIFLAPLCRYA